VAKRTDVLDRWTCEDAAELYGIHNWGSPYFHITGDGEVAVTLGNGDNAATVSLTELVAGAKARGLDMPVLLRFSDILDSRIKMLNESFAKAMSSANYLGVYRGVYPIKVNQQQQVIEEIVRFGGRYHHGLEAGSKAELIAAMAYMHDPDGFIVCNGYKDEEFIDLALYCLKMGIPTVLVLEMPFELNLILERAERMQVRPVIGVRVKLSSRAGGHWTESAGDQSVFGLSSAQVIDAVDELRRQDKLDCLRMLHYHIGSQVPHIRNIRNGVAEACRFYVDLVKEGAPMGILDVGGGLAVDYDGSKTNSASSRNYGLDEYCADIVEGIMMVLDPAGVPHPTVLSESGRAVVAYYSVLLFNILDVGRYESHVLPDVLPPETPSLVRDLMDVITSMSTKNVQECYHDAVYYRDELRSGFLHGRISLRQRALGEQIFWHIVMRISREIEKLKYVPEELQGLTNALSDTYYGNFSVFQSLPDAWAIDQLFPIMPIHRLNEKPTREATLSDITCDCDGKIDRFIDLHDIRRTLPVHELKEGQEYIMAAFLIGAYQETLGDLHNLFGDTNVVSVRVDEDGEIEFSNEITGDNVGDVLSYVEFEPKALVDRVRRLAERAIRQKLITPQERGEIVSVYKRGLRGYTYFEP